MKKIYFPSLLPFIKNLCLFLVLFHLLSVVPVLGQAGMYEYKVRKLSQGERTRPKAQFPAPTVKANTAAAATNAPAPDWEWAKTAGEGAGLNIATDNQGNSYLAGLLGEYAAIKYNAAGQVEWAQKAGDIGRGIAVDAEGNTILLGEFSETTTIGPFTLTSETSFGLYLAKYDAVGQVVWAKKILSDYGTGLELDQFGNIYVLTAQFIAKYTPQGQQVWVQNAVIEGYGYNGLAVDVAGNSYTIGNFRGSISLGGATLVSSGQEDAVIVKRDPQGEVVWARKIVGSIGYDYATGVAVDKAGNSYVIGVMNSAGFIGSTSLPGGDFVAKYNALGQVVWAMQGVNQGTGIDLDEQNNIYVGGSIWSYEDDGSMSAILSIVKYNSQGQLDYTQESGGESMEFPYAFATDALGNSYLSGEFSADFGPDPVEGTLVFGSTTLPVPAGGIGHAFMGKLGNNTQQPDPLSVNAGPDQKVYAGYPPAACATLTAGGATGGTPGYTYRWSTGQTGPSIQVCPTATTLYVLTITDAASRTSTDEVQVIVEDVSCGNNEKNKKVVLCHNPSGKPGKEQTLCVSINAVKAHLAKGATLGSCSQTEPTPSSFTLQVYPNPTPDNLLITLSGLANTEVEVVLYDKHGKLEYRGNHKAKKGTVSLSMRSLNVSAGLHYLRVNTTAGSQTQRFIKE